MSLNLQEQINHLQAQLDALRRIHENPTLTNQDGAEFIPVSKNINGEWVDYKIVNTLGKDLDVLVESSDFVVSNVLNKKIVIASGSINITIDAMVFTPIEKGLRVELIQATTTAPTLVVGQGATLLYDSETVPDFNGINSGLRLTYLGDNDWYIEKITSKSSLLPVIDLSSITTPQTGQVILDSEDLNALKYFNGTDFVGIESAFKLVVQQTGAVDETKNVARSGKTSFGGDEPLHQVEVIGDFFNKEIFANGSESTIQVAGSLFGDFGIPANIIKGITAILKKQGTNAYGGYAITETDFGVVEDLAAGFGLQIGNPTAPTDFGRIKAFRVKDGDQEFITDIETKNGSRLNRLRVRDGYLETQKPIQLNGYAGLNGLEGYEFEDTTNGTQTIGAPTHALAIGENNYLMKKPLGSEMLLAEVPLSISDIENINTTPKVLIEGKPGHVIFISACRVLVYGDGETDWTTNGGNSFLYVFDESAPSFGFNLFSSSLLGFNFDGMVNMSPTISTSSRTYENSNVVLSTNAGNPSAGTITYKFIIEYKYIAL